MKAEVFGSMEEAMLQGIDDTWAFISIEFPNDSSMIPANSSAPCPDLVDRSSKYEETASTKKRKGLNNENRPRVTIRMHPMAVPDTRSYRYGNY